jgi:hypothetical protein
MQMKSTSAAWELLVCIGIGLLISGISDGLSNFFVVVTCIAVAVSWLTFSNVPAGLLFLLLYLFLLMVSFTLASASVLFSQIDLNSFHLVKIRLYRAIGGALSFMSPIPLVSTAWTAVRPMMAIVYLMACFQVMLHMALGLLANIYPSQPLHITRLLVGVPLGLLLICQVFW